MGIQGAGSITGSQLMAEIRDVRRFTSKGSLLAFAGVEAPTFQSGIFDFKSSHVSKTDSAHRANPENAVFQFGQKAAAPHSQTLIAAVNGTARLHRPIHCDILQKSRPAKLLRLQVCKERYVIAKPLVL